MSKIIKELELKISSSMENKYRAIFDRQSRYMGNGVYNLGRHYSTDTRELFLMFIADMEDISYDDKVEETEDEVE